VTKLTSSPPRPAPTWHELIEDATLQLGSANEARWIAEEFPGRDVAPALAVRAEFDRLVERRRAGEPLQRVLGHWSFRTTDLLVDERALIPRPETEIVVEYALRELSRFSKNPLVLDLGTGSGAIACAIVCEHRGARVIATDVSTEAIALARANRNRLGVDGADRIELRVGDWFEALSEDVPGRIDLVVSNPPYVTEGEWAQLDPVVRDFDPKIALVAGAEGTEAIAEVIGGSPRVLASGGSLIVEIAPTQTQRATALARGAGARDVRVHEDLAGKDRVLVARW
jgi:release factor glutamine methyltransferase